MFDPFLALKNIVIIAKVSYYFKRNFTDSSVASVKP